MTENVLKEPEAHRGRGCEARRRSHANPRRLAVVFALLFAPLLLAGCGSDSPADLDRPDRHGYHGTVVDPPFELATVPLEATEGGTFDLARDDRDLDVVFFGYTNCPDICQIVMGTIASAYARLDEADRQRVRVVFVTTDPARDDAARLRSYLSRFNPDFTGVTGRLPRIEELGHQLGVAIEKGERLPSGGYEVTHSTQVFAVAEGRSPLLWSGTVSPTDLAADIHRLLDRGGTIDTGATGEDAA